jgi:beta-glucosidase/6-phospho-beta-glucosidase/beta-galactosidase
MTVTSALEIWGGVECSVVRTADGLRNQLLETGHFERDGDIALMADIGLRTVRYPVLWEMVEEQKGIDDWSWTDNRINLLKAHGIAPIAGLVHHGSGPSWTDLLDPAFPELLAAYAGRVAARYPWIGMYTPVNEPFTTARICGLYGLWHPFGIDEATSLRITVTECRAVALAMKAIRKVNPSAKLVQTEDFGRVFSTPHLKYQAAYENKRRWLSIDLLTGRVTPRHCLYERLIEAGVSPAHLEELAREPCPPDVIGIDYYLTSDRVIDERLELYPDEQVGGNGRENYVDVAAVRSDVPRIFNGLAGRLRELWQRYQLPIAITELHNGCTRDEHLRWFVEGWQVANAARRKGIDIRAVTSWSLFGACDWNSMMTRKAGYYECGAFDSRYKPPRPTSVAHAIDHLSRHGSFDHPVLDRPGWWRKQDHVSHASRPLVLAGFDRQSTEIEECCARRRLRVVPAGSGASQAADVETLGAWGVVSIENSRKARKTGGCACTAHIATAGIFPSRFHRARTGMCLPIRFSILSSTVAPVNCAVYPSRREPS